MSFTPQKKKISELLMGVFHLFANVITNTLHNNTNKGKEHRRDNMKIKTHFTRNFIQEVYTK